MGGKSFDTQDLCLNTACLYTGKAGNDQNNISIQAFCPWTDLAVEVFGSLSVVGYFLVAIFSLALYYKNPAFGNRSTILAVVGTAGMIGFITGVTAFVDVGQNGCSNGDFVDVFNGHKTPALHFAFAFLELLFGLILVGSAIVYSRIKLRVEAKDDETLGNSLLTA